MSHMGRERKFYVLLVFPFNFSLNFRCAISLFRVCGTRKKKQLSFVVSNATELGYYHYAVSMPFWITATELSRRYNRNSGPSIMCVVVRAFSCPILRQRQTRSNTVTNFRNKNNLNWFVSRAILVETHCKHFDCTIDCAVHCHFYPIR